MTTDTPASMRREDASGPNKNSMVARAGIARTFGGLGGFLAIMFLGAGTYLLQEAFSDPLRAQAVGLIAGAFILALATNVVFHLQFTVRIPPQKGSSTQSVNFATASCRGHCGGWVD
jgi:hypothetical protein